MDTPAFYSRSGRGLQSYLQGNIVMILDNGRNHHLEQVQIKLQEHSRLQFVFLPRYSPDFNLIEGLWKFL
ncbi:transposase [Paenibacillus sp. JSM ZJ436]|uniref:transposase n=1 Tax=Paenibacillus TaxID=44249 RepID=UPI0037B72FDA